ncbi:transcription termination/antitermination protein NusG [Candidatus Similichlamydia laticola]|uniref:Transcription termination/antitermination protein NusG n=1 Tax=Candidatus Similichlamydia laticola TaxID=2170265 RepID=A0A369KE17_9BACT|nr:transcription termination/antitermination protein NusG [Candidatus Similichlamydia laticola]RDB31700.1 Transcription antitermination protein NusG [Candidatus Similichlamydia laticola]
MLCYVVRVLSGREKKVKRAIEESCSAYGLSGQISEVILPVEQVAEVRRGKQRVSEKRIWPGYLLVRMEMNQETWSYIKSVEGVIEFLGGEQPVPLAEDEVETLRQDLKKKKEKISQKHRVSVGDRVKIVEGVFVNFVGTVTEVCGEKGRLSVALAIFGRTTTVDDLEFWQVEEVSDEQDIECHS